MQLQSTTDNTHTDLPYGFAVHQQVTELAGLHIVPDNHTVTQVIV